MSNQFSEKIQILLNHCEENIPLTQEEAELILDSRLQGEPLKRLYSLADRKRRRISGNRPHFWTAIGVDSVPCSRNCRFCSHGAAWGAFEKPFELSIKEILRHIERLIPSQPDWITFRTTQDYGIEKICHLSVEARKIIPSEIKIVVNTGEFSFVDAQKMKDAGVQVVYHTIRLREGIDTGISIAEREETLHAIQKADLELAALIEPIGPEHTNRELVETVFRLKSFGLSLSGAMARVPVPGTPLFELGQVDEERIVRVVAMTRLVFGDEVQAICVHPPISKALQTGGNTVVIESGAIPRDSQTSETPWRGFSPLDAKLLFQQNGFIQ